MKNITISMPEGVASWLRVYAAQHDKSVSKFVGDMLKERMEVQRGCQYAKDVYFARETKIISDGKGYPKRDELYARG